MVPTQIQLISWSIYRGREHRSPKMCNEIDVYIYIFLSEFKPGQNILVWVG